MKTTVMTRRLLVTPSVHLTPLLTPSPSARQRRRYWLPAPTKPSHVTRPSRPITSRRRRSTTTRRQRARSLAVGAACRSSVELTSRVSDRRGCRTAAAPRYRAMDCRHCSTELPAYWRSSTNDNRTRHRVLRLPAILPSGPLSHKMRRLRRR